MAFKISNFTESIKGMFSFKREKIKLKDLLLIFSLITIFTIALLIRLTPAIYEVILKGFDPWFQYRQTEYIIENGYFAWFNWHDPNSWYPWGRDVPGTSYPGLPFAAAAVYIFLTSIGLQITLLEFCWLWPAVMGAITAVATYFLGKELGSKKIGLIAAFLMALIPAYTQRTIAGFFDNETIGILLMVLTTYFYLRSIRKESYISSIFAGLSLGYLTISWGAHTYFYYLFPLFNIILLITKKHKSFNTISYAITFGISLLIAVQFPILGGISFITSSSGIVCLGGLGILLIYEILNRFRKTNFYQTLIKYKTYVISSIISGIGALIIIIFITGLSEAVASFLVSDLGVRFISILDPLAREAANIVASVGEHATTSWGVFYYYLYIPIFLLPVGVYFAIKQNTEVDILLLLYCVTSIYFAASMIRLLLILAPIVCLFAAIGLVNIMKTFTSILAKDTLAITPRRRRVSKTVGREYAVVVFGIIFILLAANTLHAFDLSRQFSTPEMIGLGIYDDWQESFIWMRNNIGEDKVILSWWDYGYWITAVGNRTSLMDNGTFNYTQIATLGKALISGDVEALHILREYGVDYILVHFGYFLNPLSGDEGKWIWMVRIASDYYPEIQEEDYYNSSSGPTDKFYDTLIYKLLFYKEPGDYDFASQVGQYMNQLGYPMYQTYPASDRWMFVGSDTQYPIYDEAFISKNNLVKIYQVNYTILDMSLNITSIKTYTFDNKTVSLITVENNGSTPITIDTSSTAVKINGSTVSSLGGSVSVAEGSPSLNVGENVTLKIDLDLNYTVGEQLNLNTRSVEFYGYITAQSSSDITTAGTQSISIINVTAYSNETIFLKVENTGGEYLTVNQITVNSSSTGVNVLGDLTLAPNQIEEYKLTLDRNANPNFNLNISDIINVNISTWDGPSAAQSGIVVQQPPGYSFTLNNLNGYSNETILFNIYNNGSYSIELATIQVNSGLNSITLTTDYIQPVNGTGFNIAPSETIRFLANWSPSLLNLNQSDIANMSVTIYEGITVQSVNFTIEEPPGYSYTINSAQIYDNETIY
ncbi:MAG: STT3 domain-containing protein, partial [Candidatus Odinarchaeia archaeon]